MNKKTIRLCLCAAAIAWPVAAKAAIITRWDFNSGTIAPSVGAGTMTLFGGTAYNMEDDPGKVDPNDPGGNSIEVSDWPSQTAANRTAGVQFAVSTAGKSGIKVKFDLRHSIKDGETSTNSLQFQYSTNGGSAWVDGPIWTANGDQWYLNREIDLSGVPAVNNNSNFRFRIVGVWQPGFTKYMPCEGSIFARKRKVRMDLITVHNDPAPANVKTVALWDFNDQRDLIADYGDGSSSANPLGGIALDGDGYSDDFLHDEEPWDFTNSSDPSIKGKGLDTAGYPAQGVGNKTSGLEFKVSTVDSYGIKISFDVKHKSMSAKHLKALYTTNINGNPVVWTEAPELFTHEITDFLADAVWFNNNIVDLTGAAGVDNNPNFAFRIVTAFDPVGSGYAASKPGETYNADPYYNKHRWDMVRVTAQSGTESFAPASIVAAKLLPEWNKVDVTGGIVTDVHPDYLWIRSVGSRTGIQVYAPQHNVDRGWTVNVKGVTREKRDTEKFIYAKSVTATNVIANLLKPVGMSLKTLGGEAWNYDAVSAAGQAGAPLGVGLNNIGVHTKVWGRVTAVLQEDDDPTSIEYIYINDGTDYFDGTLLNPDNTIFEAGDDISLTTPINGVRVTLTKNYSSALLHVGDFVEVVGVSSLDRVGNYTDAICRCIRRPVIRKLN